MRCALFCALSSVLGTAGLAEEDEITVERPLLWEMQHPGSDTASFLFGTIHVNHPEITKLHPQVQDAFHRSQSAYFEIDFTRDNDAQVRALSLPDGQTLEQLVSKRTVARIDQHLKELSPLLTRSELPEFHVVMWPIMLANLEAQVRYLGTLPMDLQLHQAAREAGKKTGGLEDPLRQLKPLTNLPLDQQVEFLEASLDVLDEDDTNGADPLDTLIRLYAKGDERQLGKFLDRELHRPKLSDELETLFVTTLLTERNRRMVAAIDERVRQHPDQTIFIAVGAAHLIGTDSVIAGLRDRDYVVRRTDVADDDNEQDANADNARNGQ